MTSAGDLLLWNATGDGDTVCIKLMRVTYNLENLCLELVMISGIKHGAVLGVRLYPVTHIPTRVRSGRLPVWQ